MVPTSTSLTWRSSGQLAAAAYLSSLGVAMLRIIAIGIAFFVPIFAVGLYAAYLIFATNPIGSLTIEKAGQFGDSFGVITCLFSGLAFSGVLVTLFLQRQANKNSQIEHNQNIKLTALSALLSVYNELATTKETEFLKFVTTSSANYDSTVASRLESELSSIKQTRDRIYAELEKAAGLNVTAT